MNRQTIHGTRDEVTRRLCIAIGALLVSGLLLVGCSERAAPESADTVGITVSIPPQRYFVERVGGGRVDVNVMVQPGDNPHTYEPKPEQLRALGESAAYLRIRVEFEGAWMERIMSVNPDMMIVDTTEGIERRPMAAYGSEEAEYGPGNLDPHIWLSPVLVKIQAQTIYETLARLDPEHREEYKVNLDAFTSDIDELDTDIREALEGIDDREFMVLHPSWGYFARDYGLRMIPIEIGGQEPSAAELAKLITKAREEDIKVIFAQPQFSKKTAETIAGEIGGEVLLIDPLAYDWMDNMRHVAETLAKASGQ